MGIIDRIKVLFGVYPEPPPVAYLPTVYEPPPQDTHVVVYLDDGLIVVSRPTEMDWARENAKWVERDGCSVFSRPVSGPVRNIDFDGYVKYPPHRITKIVVTRTPPEGDNVTQSYWL